MNVGRMGINAHGIRNRGWELLPIGGRLPDRHPDVRPSKGAHHRNSGLDRPRPRGKRDRQALHRGNEPAGVLGTLAVGVVGAIVGGLIASAVGIGGIGGFFSVGTWVVAIAGALLLLIVYGTLAGEGRSSHTAG